MANKRRKTAGELSLKAASDKDRYDLREVAEAALSDIPAQVYECARSHLEKLNEPEFCVVLIRAGDPLLHNAVRKKTYAWLYLPDPRPEQAVFLYRKANDSIKLLWSLPSAKVMAVISEMRNVAPQWASTKRWSDYFYSGKFHEMIRKEHGIKLESQDEYLNANREELIKAGCQHFDADLADAFYFSKVLPDKIVYPDIPFSYQRSLDSLRKT